MSQQEISKYDFQNQESSAYLADTSKCEPEVERKGMVFNSNKVISTK